MKVPASFRWYFLLVAIVICLFPGRAYAIDTVFSDEFSFLDGNHWDPYPNLGGYIKIVDNKILSLSSVPGKYFPYITLKNVVIPDKNFSIETNFIFSGSVTYGDGLIFTDKLLSNGTSADLNLSDLIFAAWPLNESTVDICSSLCLKDSVNCTNGSYSHIVYMPSNVWTKIKIEEIDNHYILTVGDQSFETHDSSRKISHFWAGNPQMTSNIQSWPSIQIDYFKIFDLSITKKVPVIIIPGLGASWDVAAILSGSVGGDWQVPSFVKTYDGLNDSFLQAGYSDTDNKNLFVFAYDWRKSLLTLSERLNNFIETNIPEGEKVNLVGHSMGGLVARAYVKEYGSDRVNKIVTVGSPNMGTTKAYGVWEGATIWDDIWWGKVALDLTTHFGSLPGESKVQTVQRLAPSFKDLLPTYDFNKLNGNLIPWSSLGQKNDYLNGMNQDVSNVDDITTTISSKDIPTDTFIKTISPSAEDLALNMWVDGKPVSNPFEPTDGDGTVTETSSKGPFTNNVQGTGWHDQLVTNVENIKKIFGVLGLDQSKALNGTQDSRRDVFVAALRSPGTLEVCNLELRCNADLGLYFPDNKLFMLPGYNDENLVVKITENGEKGTYSLHLGNINETSNWTIVKGNLTKSGQVDSYSVQGVIVKSPPSYADQCKNNGWKAYSFFGLKNQGLCVSYVERNEKARNKFYWWL